MADNSNDIKSYKEKLEKAIEDGVKLFKHYKEISKDFQNMQKKLMNNQELKKISANLKQKYDEEKKSIVERRIKILKRRQSISRPSDIKHSNSLNSELENKERDLKNKYEKELIKRKEAYEKLSEIYLVNSDKTFLKEKEKIRKKKIRILSRIKSALAQLKKKMFVPEFKDFIKYIYSESYNTVDGKEITFKKLMHHLESGEITEEAAKKTKKINELQTINNIDNRKSEIEYEIDKIKKEKKKNEKKNALTKKLIEIKKNIIEIFKKNFKGITIPKDLLLIIKMLDQQKLLSSDNKEKVKLLKNQLKSIVSRIQASS